MKKYGLIAFFFFSIILSCENLNTDLPNTDILKYQTPTGFEFPVNTETVDIYNCLISAGLNNNSENIITAGSKYEITQSAVLNGINTTDTKTRNIDKIQITYEESGPQIHEYGIILIFDDGSTDFYSYLPQAENKLTLHCHFYYKWQRQTTNVWKNDKTTGKLILNL
ncbi:hypothetical protein [Treponema primitia]|nr:hypothetical protein [Treponema primitia]